MKFYKNRNKAFNKNGFANNPFLKILFLTISIVILIKIIFFKKSGLENLAANISHPFLIIGSKISQPIEKLLKNKQDYSTLLSSYLKIKQENEDYLAKLIKLKSTQHYEEKSQEILDFKKRYSMDNAIFADIILKNITKSEHYIIINKGSIHGIKKDMLAIYKLQIIGRVIEAHRWHSKILLITDRKSNIASYANHTNANGICQGINDINNINFNFVPHYSKLEINDFVISSGKGLIYPEGFCIGKINKFKKNGLYFDIDIKPLIEIEKLENCLITDQEKISIQL